MPLLDIKDLTTCFETKEGNVKAVNNVSFSMNEGEVLGIVGESGCGKSVLSLSILRLLPMPPAFFSGGSIHFMGKDLLKLSSEEVRKIRGNRISMIFQEPMTALNPVYTVGNQLSEVFATHEGASRKKAMDRSVEMLASVGVPDPESRVKEYPYQMSGGMRQRVMIAMALGCRPNLLIADEPTTALDVTIQAQIIDLMKNLQSELGTSIIMVTHDLGVIAEITHKVLVMYTGTVMETADTETLYDNPLHPYTKGLMKAIPGKGARLEKEDLYEIRGVVPSLWNLPQGCSFNTRCDMAGDICRKKTPELREVGTSHYVSCWMVNP